VIEACDRQGVAVILGCYYQRQDQILTDEAAVRAGIVNTVKWIGQCGFSNVVLEVANEYAHGGFDHRLLKSAAGQAELIALAKRTAPKLLVSTSGMGSGRLPAEIAEASDFLLIHFNSTRVDDIPARIAELKKYGKPIVCNEDDKIGAEAAQAAGGFMGVVTYSAEVGRLSAAFVWERLLRATAPRLPSVRYPIGGWSRVIGRMAAHARSLGVQITTGVRVEELPEAPVIVATGLDAARMLLGDDTLRWTSGHAVLLDLGLRSNRDDLFLVSDLDAGAFVEQFSMTDPSLAPAGHSVGQALLPTHDDEPRGAAVRRLEQVVDRGMPGWRDRVAWRREATARGRTGALDRPGETWADRPAIERGDGVWLVGDSVAAPGLLSEVAVNSALIAASAAVRATVTGRAART
jgi:hypothetical protein